MKSAVYLCNCVVSSHSFIPETGFFFLYLTTSHLQGEVALLKQFNSMFPSACVCVCAYVYVYV